MRLPSHQLALPLAGFLVLGGVAAAVSGTAGDSAAARCHAQVRGYLSAVRAGDVPQAATYRADGDGWSELERVRSRAGVPFFVENLALEDGDTQARVRVVWPGVTREAQIWRRERDAGWVLVGLGVPGPGPP